MIQATFALLIVLASGQSNAKLICDLGGPELWGQSVGISTKCEVNAANLGEERLKWNASNFSQTCSNATDVTLSFSILYNQNELDEVNSFKAVQASLPAECQSRVSQLGTFLYSFNGISADFKFYHTAPPMCDLTIYHSNIRKRTPDGEVCRPLPNITRPTGTLSGAYNLNFWGQNRFHSRTCDQLFLNAFVNSAILKDMVQSLVKQNYLGFAPSLNEEQLNSFVGSVMITGYGLDITGDTFPQTVFAQTKDLSLEGWIRSFESEVFVGKKLANLKLNLINDKSFWYNNLKWLDGANRRTTNQTLTVNLISERPSVGVQLLSQLDKSQQMTIAQDFCLFHRIKALGLDVRLTGYFYFHLKQEGCNCELYWMTENLRRKPVKIPDECTDKCDFAQITSRCQLNQTSKVYNDPPIYSLTIKAKYVEYLFTVILRPSVNAIAMIANLLVILTFRAMKRSTDYRRNKLIDKNRRMWDYVYINSAFNLLLAAIFSLDLLTNCVEYNGIYCTPFYFTRFAQVIYLFVESYLGNVLRLMSNLTNSMFVLYRYGANLECLPRLRKWRPRRVVASALVASLLLSCIKIWLNERLNIDFLSEDLLFFLSQRNYSFDKVAGLQVIYFANLLMCNVLFTIVNLTVDCRLLLHLKRHKEKNRKEEAESKITKMIVLNGFFSFLFRSPEIAVSLGTILFKATAPCFLELDSLHSLCLVLSNIAQGFLSLSLVENFFMLLLFNADFRKHLSSLLYN
nr:G protein-coupled receptor [Proales similis]